jgi:hypothetical protein
MCFKRYDVMPTFSQEWPSQCYRITKKRQFIRSISEPGLNDINATGWETRAGVG